MADAVLDVADRLEPAAKRLYLDIVARTRASYDEPTIASLIRSGDVVGVYERVRDLVAEERLRAGSDVEDLLLRGVNEAHDAGLEDEPHLDVIAGGLQNRNPHAERWVRENAARRVKVTEPTRRVLNRIISRDFEDQVDPRVTARRIRPHIGLLPNHQTAVESYAENLRVPRPQRLVDTYSRRLLAYRATMIARTEALNAVNAGLVLLWAEQADLGLLNPHTVDARWVVTPDDRLCPWCAPMEGDKVPVADVIEAVLEDGSAFTATHKGFRDGSPPPRRGRALRPDPRSQPRDRLGQFIAKAVAGQDLVKLDSPISVATPPLHPHCRCRLVLDWGRSLLELG